MRWVDSKHAADREQDRRDAEHQDHQAGGAVLGRGAIELGQDQRAGGRRRVVGGERA
jgi:hypothetical protein